MLDLHMEWLWRSLTVLLCVVVKQKVKQDEKHKVGKKGEKCVAYVKKKND